jgi:hypothetical protein
MAGTLTISTLSDGTNSTSSTNCIQGSAKAWVNFNGTVTTPSTIRASYNVSSITRNGTGDYTINFTNALTDANYAATCSSRQLTASGYLSVATDVNTSGTALTRTTTTYQIQCQNVVGGLNDNPYMQVIILR